MEAVVQSLGIFKCAKLTGKTEESMCGRIW